MDSMPLMVTSLVRTVTELLTSLVFLYLKLGIPCIDAVFHGLFISHRMYCQLWYIHNIQIPDTYMHVQQKKKSNIGMWYTVMCGFTCTVPPRISPMMTFMYATAVPAFQVAAQAYLRLCLSYPVIFSFWFIGLTFEMGQLMTAALQLRCILLLFPSWSGKQAKGSLRRERGLEGVANRVVAEACEMIKVAPRQSPTRCQDAARRERERDRERQREPERDRDRYSIYIYIYIIYPTHIEYAFFQFCSWTRTQIYWEYAPISCSCFFPPFGLRSGRISSKEREVPLSNRIQESKIVGWGKTKKVFTWCLVAKIKNWQGPQIDWFLFTFCTEKYIFFYHKGSPPTNGGDPWEMVWIEQYWFKPLREIRLQKHIHRIWRWYRVSSKEREFPLSNRIQESKIVGWGKVKRGREIIDRDVFHRVFGDKIKNWQGSQIDRFLITLNTKK